MHPVNIIAAIVGIPALILFYTCYIKPNQDAKKQIKDFKSRADSVLAEPNIKSEVKRVEDCPTLSRYETEYDYNFPEW